MQLQNQNSDRVVLCEGGKDLKNESQNGIKI
jgi:hypothetical protein